MTIYPILIVPMFNKLEPLKPGKLKESVEALASKLNFPLSELQVIDGSKRSAHSNAYFTGLPWIGKKKIVIYAKQDIELGDEITYGESIPPSHTRCSSPCGQITISPSNKKRYVPK